MKMDRRKFLKKSFQYGLIGLFSNFLFEKIAYGGVNAVKVAKDSPYKPQPESWSEENLSIAWIGHSTFLINFYGTTFLTDPVLSNRIGLYFLGTNWGPQRLVQPALSFEEIPKPDFILLSHSHFDHLDYTTLKAFTEKFPNQIDLITAFGMRDIIDNLEWRSIKEIDWDESHLIHDIKITGIKVKHFGWRYPWEIDRSKGNPKGRSYNSYILEKNGKKILFAGDTGFSNLYKSLNNEKIDIALMPIGAYNPWKHAHCNPEEALTMSKDMNAKYFIPMHTRTFPHGREPYDEPIQWLKKSASKYDIKVCLEEIGQTYILE